MSSPAPGLGTFQLYYEISPIILTGGIALGLTGNAIPLINFTEPGLFPAGALSPAITRPLDSFFARYEPMVGATLIDNQIGQYPFANQSVAANAIITQPLRVSMMMLCPAKGEAGFRAKTQLFSGLQQTLAQHNNLAGTYTVATPTYLYTNCIMTSFRDISGGESKQVQTRWQMDFMQPLLTLEAASAAMNLQMQKMAAQLPIPGDPPKATAVGVIDPNIATSLIPSSRPLVGASPR